MEVRKRYMLDTNMASYIIKGKPSAVRKHLYQVSMSDIGISAITEAELLLGVAKNPAAKQLPIMVKEFLLRVDILPWNSKAAGSYAELRTACEKIGKSLGAMDMLIAAHAKAESRVLVTNDTAFYQLENFLQLENWTKAT